MSTKDKGIQLHIPIPKGTQVVTRVDILDEHGKTISVAGTVGRVIAVPIAPEGKYLVQLVNGIEAQLPRKHLTVRKLISTNGIDSIREEILSQCDFYQYIIYRCIVGSHAYGLSDEASDIDRRGFYLPPADLQWSLIGAPEQLEKPETEECYWELQKFIVLALRANPNVLECLYTPLVELVTPLAQELIDQREIFITRLVYQTFNGYVVSQFKRLEQDLRSRHEIRWKHAMHLIRLLLSGIKILREGYLTLSVDEFRDQLLAIRNGAMPWEEVNHWRLRLHVEFENVYQITRLPAQPDYRKANDFLVRARKSMVRE